MTTMNQHFLSRVQPGFILSWLLLVASAYLLTYSATPQSTDTLRIFDATSSFARYGDIARDETISIEAPQLFNSGLPYPIIDYDEGEALTIGVASLLYQMADLVPGVGYVHVVWLLNILVGLGCVLLFYTLALSLGYDQTASTWGALLLGVATGLWVYSASLFREPLVMFWLLLCVVLLEQARRGALLRRLLWTLLALGVFIAAYFTKNSSLFAVPALLIFALPPRFLPDAKRLRRFWDVVLLAAIALLIGVIFNQDVYRAIVRPIYDQLQALNFNSSFVRPALHTYLISIGSSLWATSPVLLLGVPGAWLLIRQGKRRILWATVAMIAGYAVGHAVLTGVHWFGGLSWPPRFLIPVLPFALLLVLPVLRWFVEQKRAFLKIVVLILMLYSVCIQIIGVISFFGNYVEYLPPEANGLYEWLPGLNSVEYLRWLLLPRTWGTVGFDVAWARIHNAVIPLLLVLLILGALLLIWQRKRRWALWGALVGWAALLVITFIGLRTLYREDPLFWADKPALFEVLNIVQQEAKNGEPLLLADDTYARFIMNYYVVDNARPIVLGFQPGEAPSDIAPPRVISEYSPELLELYVPRALDFLAANHERIWLLAPNSEFLPWAVRPVERYLGENYYLIQEYRTDDPTVRLLLYSTVRAPNRYEFRLPENITDLHYGDAINLLGFTLPNGTDYAPGDALSITFFWQAQDTPQQNSVVAWFLVADGEPSAPEQGFDSVPDAGFRSVLSWQAGEIIYDNRAIQIPVDLPPGEYRIWVLMYLAGSGGTQRIPVMGNETIDGEIGVLPVTVHIEAN